MTLKSQFRLQVFFQNIQAVEASGTADATVTGTELESAQSHESEPEKQSVQVQDHVNQHLQIPTQMVLQTTEGQHIQVSHGAISKRCKTGSVTM